ncbi:MAG: 23S rRNA (guanosine(2251)-2'-O)-methyltransferase RlmB [Bacilli bacterium]|nr:23S rRNA (guanosine(2251)-2'-O)-methyltransferase RlmB [Bacilli bacterium]
MKKDNFANLIYGRNAVKEALSANRVLKAYVSPSYRESAVLKLLHDKVIPQVVKSNNELNELAQGGVHQGIVAVVKPYEFTSLETILVDCEKVKKPILVMLDGVVDPHNLGAILRCCDIFGVNGLLIGKHSQVGLNATVAKTSAGAINYVPVAQVGNLSQTLETLKKKGFWVVAADGNCDRSYLDLDYDFPTVLVIGNEGSGISPLVLKNSDFIVKIPMYGKVNSLNASVATGIFLAKIKG